MSAECMGGNKNQSLSSILTVVEKCVIIVFFLIGLALFSLSIFADAYYRDCRPTEPQPAQGRIYATRLSKGVWVYLTRKEQAVYEFLMPLSVVSIFFHQLGAQYVVEANPFSEEDEVVTFDLGTF
jgi:hypothetical protein